MVKTFNRLITNVNRTIRNNKKNEWLVIHYVGAVSTAQNNCKYFQNVNRKASAHYFVDENSIWQCVEDKDEAWHVGGAKVYYNKCRNNNSIGIEMCCKKKDGKWFIEPETINNTIWLASTLMKKYSIPIERLTTHYLTTHKICPEPFVREPKQWEIFKERVAKELADIPEKSATEKREMVKKVNNLDDKTINYLFDDYFWREPLLDKFYLTSVHAAKWRKYLENGGKDIEL